MFAADPTTAIAHAFETLEQSGITKLTTENAKQIISAKDPLARANEMVAKSGEVMVIGENAKERDYWSDCLWVGIFWTLTLIGKTLAMLFSAVILPTSARILREKMIGECKECVGKKDGCAWHYYCGLLFLASSLLLIFSLAISLRYVYSESYGLWPWMENLVNLSGGKPTLRLAIFLIFAANICSGLIEIGHHLKKRKAEESAQKAPTPASRS